MNTIDNVPRDNAWTNLTVTGGVVSKTKLVSSNAQANVVHAALLRSNILQEFEVTRTEFMGQSGSDGSGSARDFSVSGGQWFSTDAGFGWSPTADIEFVWIFVPLNDLRGLEMQFTVTPGTDGLDVGTMTMTVGDDTLAPISGSANTLTTDANKEIRGIFTFVFDSVMAAGTPFAVNVSGSLSAQPKTRVVLSGIIN